MHYHEADGGHLGKISLTIFRQRSNVDRAVRDCSKLYSFIHSFKFLTSSVCGNISCMKHDSAFLIPSCS